MEGDTTQVKKDGHEKHFMSKKQPYPRFKRAAMQRVSLIARAYRRRYKPGLQVGEDMTLEELHKKLSEFAVAQWEALPKNASDWERGQIDGLFWALDKIDEYNEQ